MTAGREPKGALDDRLLKYAVRVIAICRTLPKSYIGTHIGKQMLRSGTSAGANYQEAIGSESRRDFVHKMQLSLKELRETLFWLKVLKEAKIMTPERLALIIQESDELIAMTVASIKTAKGRKSDDA